MTSWVSLDFETANEQRGSPCAVSLVAVENGVVVEQLTTLIQPPPSCARFSPFCVAIHGITKAAVADAPSWPETLSRMVRFIDGRTLVAHNAAFDIGVIRSACDEMDMAWPELTYACSLVVARRTWPLLSYSLPWVAAAADHQLLDHHNPSTDALAAAAIMTAAGQVHSAGSLSELLALLRIRTGQVTPGNWRGCHHFGVTRTKASLPGASPHADPDGPLFGHTVCFTGTLASMTRNQALDLVAECGGQPAQGVTKATDLLIIGDQDPRKFAPGAVMSAKQQKAATLLRAGHAIEVIPEYDFLQRLAATEGITIDLHDEESAWS